MAMNLLHFEFSNGSLVNESMDNTSMLHAHPLYPSLRYFYVFCLAMESFFGTLGNILVIATVCSMAALRTTGNYFIINLSLADLLVTVVTQPSSILGALFGEEWFQSRPVVCSIVGTLCAMGCIASTWNICMISVNRYILICHYPHYSKIYTKRNTILLCLSVWILIYLIEMPNHIGWGDTRFSEVFFVCTFANHIHSFALFYILVGVMIPVSVSCAAYVGIFRRVRKSNLVRNRILNDQDKPANKPSSKEGRMNLREFHRNVRIARALFRVFVIFLIMWVPVTVLILMGQGKQVNYVWYILTVLLAHGNSSVNCVVYALSLEHFREGYARLLGMTFNPRKNRPNRVNTVDGALCTRDRTSGPSVGSVMQQMTCHSSNAYVNSNSVAKTSTL